MTDVFVSGLGINMVSTQTSRDTLERNVPLIRLENDADLREIYEFGRKLGQGGFGVVYEATHIETQTKWAIKKVERQEAGSSKVEMMGHEINILKQVNHAHIIHLQEVYHTATMTYLVTELCVGGELKQLLQRKRFLTEDETRHIIRSLADAVVYLHKRDIVHRDLKLENILVENALNEDDDGIINIKVTDFGLSLKTSGVGIENIMTETCGTLIYMAPEVMSGRGYSQWCDMWSIGVVMYILLCGKSPFVSKTKTNLLEEIMKKGVQFIQPIWDTVSDAAKDILACLLKADPAYRMSANQLLENPWITGDTNTPAMPSNALEMMHNDLELNERTEDLEDLSLTSFDGTLDPAPLPRLASTETDGQCRRPAEEGRSFRTPSTSTKPTKVSGGVLQRDKRKNGSETPGPLQHTTQAHARQKSSTQLSAKQHRSQDKKNVSTGQKPASELSKRRLIKSTGHFIGNHFNAKVTSQFQNALYAVTASTQCQNRKPVTQAGYAPYECRGLGLRAATGLISFGGH
ncbi:serine/threonine-protein kinase 33 isoform X2 [Cyclopterus lumpus]|nr:serine/threonine-protein kinase 33 isoform X2 [Cyclopterus lumpus]XP_034385450.1 serine/threonine-protein kinase 33 isoform X2 [Cyclopterus lumpus]